MLCGYIGNNIYSSPRNKTKLETSFYEIDENVSKNKNKHLFEDLWWLLPTTSKGIFPWKPVFLVMSVNYANRLFKFISSAFQTVISSSAPSASLKNLIRMPIIKVNLWHPNTMGLRLWHPNTMGLRPSILFLQALPVILMCY